MTEASELLSDEEWGRLLLTPGHLDLVAEYEAERAARKAAEKEVGRLTNNRDMWKGQCERQAVELTKLREALAEAIEETLWDAYNIGFEANGKWMDGARSEGEWLQRELGLEDGATHDAAMIRERIPALARELASRSALSPIPEVKE